MKLAVIGAGNVGRALAERFLAAGHDVAFGVREPSKTVALAVPALSAHHASRAADIIVLATPWSQTEAACREIGPLTGKIVIDCTNPLQMGPRGLALEIGFETSGGERVAAWCPGAAVFKTFNQTGFENMCAPQRYPARLAMFVAGDDVERKPAVLQLVADCGFEAVDAGPLESARVLEPLAMLWIGLAFAGGRNPDFAFAITRPKKI